MVKADKADKVDKVDYKKEFKQRYSASAKECALVTVPPMHYLMIDGVGDPNTSADFQAAVEALFSVSYTLKFLIKKGPEGIDYGVLPLEGLWWCDDMACFDIDDKTKWQWTVMIMQPEIVTEAHVRVAVEKVKKEKGLPTLDRMRFERYVEGLVAQILHIGPFSEEGPTVEKLHRFIAEKGCQFTGKHHEIYLSDTRRADPAKWKTIIRQPIAVVSAD
ncbi:hypothetical protein GTO91_13175 [Heliobacterium undosum]|uniref:GyrI-like small molecule binding domain-containing protein n=1 Tax=Heliomicrobium undosum TaxID=121734 RepID=A0A845L782_9FIRM|nr:GyrI-like domain-containing protein [Heliomicrobium undosum]MZP30664.1 hypothetical protein [Heliomicrobium undosum]